MHTGRDHTDVDLARRGLVRRETAQPVLAWRDKPTMSYDNQRQSSSSGAVIAIVAVVFLLVLGGLLVLGLAGMFFIRLSFAPQIRPPEPPRVVVEERPVMVEDMPAVELTAEQPVPATIEMSPPAASVRKMTIRLDPQGKILADGQSVDLDQLKNLLGNARGDGKVRLEVLVEVDGQCLFQHVAAVQAVCQEIGVDNVQVQALKGAPD
jgi:biopolymer transport protein ExbD